MKKLNIKFLNRINNQRGMSLAEVLVTLAIFVLLSGGMFMVFSVYTDYWLSNRTKIELQQEMRLAVARMSADFRQAVSFEIDLGEGSVAFPILLKTEVCCNLSSYRIVYQMNEGQLRRLVVNWSGEEIRNERIISNVNTFEVSRESGDVLKVILVGEYYPPKWNQFTDPPERRMEFFTQVRN